MADSCFREAGFRLVTKPAPEPSSPQALIRAQLASTARSSTNTTAWFLLMSFEALCTKSFLIWAILLCNLVILAFAFLQLLGHFFLPASCRSSFANFGKNFLNAYNWSWCSASV